MTQLDLEAELLVLQLQVYIENISKERVLEEQIDFGVISPYKAQVYYLRSLIKRNASLSNLSANSSQFIPLMASRDRKEM